VTTTPDVSVVIPTRNRRAVIGDTLACALGQTGVEVEVIVVDDASTDDTSSWLRDAADPRVRPLRHDERRGVAAARNSGIAAARGRWLAFLDDDDLWSPMKLARQLAAMTAAGAAWSWTGVVLVDEDLKALRNLPAPPGDRILATLLTEPVSAIPAGASSVVVDTEVARRVGGFDQDLTQLADWDLWLRLADTTSAVACQEMLVAYVRHDDSMLLTDPAPVLDEYARLSAKHARLSQRENTLWDVQRFSRWGASGHRRAGRRAAAARIYVTLAWRHRSVGDLARAIGSLMGERAWAPFNSARPDGNAVRPEWLSAYDR
jgi:glycosyltransferase involved in cell wall biosynthesis